ncbi:MAG: beta-lactamase family protein [Deltaproteobacteria bacterium]|nr:beta-lactamase family protein [Deltaproteobacteria bacterium]
MQKNIVKFLIFFLLGLGVVSQSIAQNLPTAKPEEVGLSSARLANIDKYFQSLIDKKQVAGAVTLVSRRGKIAHFKAYGMADIENKKPMQKDSMFRICSQTKLISAVAGMMLWEQGYFSLNDPVSKYIPEMKDLKVIEYDPKDRNKYTIVPAKKPMLIYQAFNFTSGFTYSGFLAGPALTKMLGDAGLNNGFWFNDYDLKEYFKRRAQIPLLNHPGEQWNYGTDLQTVARLVEIFSGMSFGDFCRERIFKPLGMGDTYFYVPKEKVPRVATLYLKTPEALEKTEPGKTYFRPELGIEEPLNPFWFTGGPEKYFGAGEGLITTTEDYAKFAQMMLNGGILNGVRILGRKTVEFLSTDHVGDIPCCKYLLGVEGWGLGVALVKDPGKNHMIGTPGAYWWGGWMNTTWKIDSKENMFFILMTQQLPGNNPYRNTFNDLVYQSIID